MRVTNTLVLLVVLWSATVIAIPAPGRLEEEATECDGQKEWMDCGPSIQVTCDMPKAPTNRMCNPGCFCPRDTPFEDDTGDCVTAEQCEVEVKEEIEVIIQQAAEEAEDDEEVEELEEVIDEVIEEAEEEALDEAEDEEEQEVVAEVIEEAEEEAAEEEEEEEEELLEDEEEEALEDELAEEDAEKELEAEDEEDDLPETEENPNRGKWDGIRRKWGRWKERKGKSGSWKNSEKYRAWKERVQGTKERRPAWRNKDKYKAWRENGKYKVWKESDKYKAWKESDQYKRWQERKEAWKQKYESLKDSDKYQELQEKQKNWKESRKNRGGPWMKRYGRRPSKEAGETNDRRKRQVDDKWASILDQIRTRPSRISKANPEKLAEIKEKFKSLIRMRAALRIGTRPDGN